MERREPSCTVGGNVKWYSQLRRIVWRLFKKLKIELPYDSAVLFLGVYPGVRYIFSYYSYFLSVFLSVFVGYKFNTHKKINCLSMY